VLPPREAFGVVGESPEMLSQDQGKDWTNKFWMLGNAYEGNFIATIGGARGRDLHMPVLSTFKFSTIISTISRLPDISPLKIP
jgi:hypothetical protein